MATMLDQDDLGYQIADAHAAPQRRDPRCMAFVEGQSSHTKIAVPDAIESNTLKVAAPEQPPGIKVATPEQKRSKVATPSILSTNGDFRRPIKVSGEDFESRQKIGMKLYGSTLNPTFKVRPRR